MNAYNGAQVLSTFERIDPSLIVLDLMLPDMSGEEICKAIRKRSRIPIINADCQG
jgi:DNA-binding response OmpR family regulator